MAEYSGRDKRLAYLFDAVENVQVDDMTGASASTDGTHGLVPAPLAGDEDKYLKGDGTWAAVQAGAGALSGLSDVDLATPTDGQALVYDGANSKWINGNVSGGTLVIQDASIYSTDEQQVGVWIDEKPLYQKTISVTASGNWPSSFTTLENLPNLETCVRIELTIHRASGAYYTANGSSSAEYISVPNYTTYKVAGGVFGVGTNPHLEYYVNGYTSSDVDKIWFTLWYTKTTDAAGSGGYKAYGLSPIIYSTEEREVGVWTDGKPLYQKTVYFSNIPASGSVSFDVANVDEVFLADFGRLYDGVTLPYVHAAAPSVAVGGFFGISANDLTWEFRCGNSATTPLYGFITARYTKTTDTAGSGTWTTKGEYAHHYSTSEKVIGTWIDGKPLYEKTLTKTFSTSNKEGATSFYHGNIDISSDIPNLKHGFVVTDASYYGTYPNERGFLFGYVEPDGSASGASVLVGTLFQRSNFTAQLTIRYTKTTD